MNGHEQNPVPDLRIAQDSRVKSEGWWDWWVWIEGTDTDLDRVEKVTWHLHPSFPQPVITSAERGDKFRLGTSGWGEFTIRAQIFLREGGELLLEHRLRLFSTDASRSAPHRGAVGDQPLTAAAEAPAPTPRRRKVFISHSLADAPVARALRQRLRDEDVEVVLPDDAGEAGESSADAIARSIAESDLVVAVTSAEAGEFQDIETDYARQKGKPVFQIELDRPSPHAPKGKQPPGADLTVHLDRSKLKSSVDSALGEASRSILHSIDRYAGKL